MTLIALLGKWTGDQNAKDRGIPQIASPIAPTSGNKVGASDIFELMEILNAVLKGVLNKANFDVDKLLSLQLTAMILALNYGVYVCAA